MLVKKQYTTIHHHGHFETQMKVLPIRCVEVCVHAGKIGKPRWPDQYSTMAAAIGVQDHRTFIALTGGGALFQGHKMPVYSLCCFEGELLLVFHLLA